MAEGVGTTHHVKVGNDLFVVRQGTYRKAGAPLFGARFTTGDPDYNNLSFWQHWAQTCWIGGMGAETWSDDAMYDEGVGIDSSTHEVAVLARDLGKPHTSYGLSGFGGVEREFGVFFDTLFCIEKSLPSKLYRFSPSANANAGGWTLVYTFAQQVRSMCGFSDKIWFGDGGASLSTMTQAQAMGSGSASTKTKPPGRTEVPWMMKVYKGLMYMGFGRRIFRMKSDETWDADGAKEFFDAAGTDYLRAAELHQGFLYIASNNGHILRIDGNQCVDLWSWDGGVTPVSLRTYDGKLFVATQETALDGSSLEGVLYQFTGSAVTELKRWGKAGVKTPLGRMRVAKRHLFYGAGSLFGIATGFGVAVYDAVEDSHTVFASNKDYATYLPGVFADNLVVDDVIVFGGYLFAATRGYGVFRTRLQFRDVQDALATYDTTAAGAAPGSANGGWLTSSDFDAGTPGLQKLWRRILVHADLPSAATSITVDYSLDGGRTWTTARSIVGDGVKTRYAEAVYLDNVVGPRFKYRVSLRTTDTTKTPQLRGIVVSYLPQGDPNWEWNMILVLNEEQKLLDGTEVKQDVVAKVARLEQAYRDQELIRFTDVDGQEWSATMPGVLISAFQKDLRYIGPASDGPLEGEVRLTLIEAVERTS